MTVTMAVRFFALVLDRTHRVLGDGFEVVLDAKPDQPLRALAQAMQARHGLLLPYPIGMREREDGRDFVFILEDDVAAPAGLAWRPLADAMTESPNADALWDLYCDRILGRWEPPTRELDVFAFGAGASMASRLAHLVTTGDKRATAMWLEAAKTTGATIPKPGLVSIVVDGFGLPRAAIRTVRTEVYKFGNMPETSAAAEGEGDRTLEDWRDAHLAFFSREAAETGLVFDDSATILMEHFEVLAVLGRSDRR
jgi:uncharacterized protein YhfF